MYHGMSQGGQKGSFCLEEGRGGRATERIQRLFSQMRCLHRYQVVNTSLRQAQSNDQQIPFRLMTKRGDSFSEVYMDPTPKSEARHLISAQTDSPL
jgi:hypothetical protein